MNKTALNNGFPLFNKKYINIGDNKSISSVVLWIFFLDLIDMPFIV